MSKIEVDRQKYLLMCIDILKSPDGMINIMTKEFAEEEILRLSQWAKRILDTYGKWQKSVLGI